MNLKHGQLYMELRLDNVRKATLEAIEVNYETDQYVKKRARMIYQNCYRLKHLNPMTLYDNSFLEFRKVMPINRQN